MSTDAAFLRSIGANLADPAPILIYADWLEEHGKEQLAYAWRWMGRRGYRPAKRARAGACILWGWHAKGTEDCLAPLPEACLPVLLFRALGWDGTHVYWESLTEAVERLARGLQVLGELAGLERQQGDP